MAKGHNLFVSYDLHAPDKNYEKVIEAVKTLGDWAKVHYSLFYVDSYFTAAEAVERVRPSLDSNDSLIVVDAANNQAAWRHLSPKVGTYIKDHWNR